MELFRINRRKALFQEIFQITPQFAMFAAKLSSLTPGVAVSYTFSARNSP
jgi:hypothetical protein